MKGFRIRLLAATLLPLTSALAAGTADRPNVLFIAVDDLRPELGVYGADHIRSPHIDRLAESGVFFTRAYCNSPQCGPSRAAVLSGLRPGPDRFFRRGGMAPSGDVKKEAPGIPTLPALFRKAGYATACLGKVYHHFGADPGGWTLPPWKVGGSGEWHRIPENFHTPEGRASLRGRPNGRTTSLPWEAADVPDNAYPDGRYADKAIELLRRFAGEEEPFFLALGFLRPHLPLNAPQRYWDLYPPETIELPDFMRLPDGAPREAAYNWAELRQYEDIPKKGPLDEEQAKTLIRAYYACVSYIDAQVGRVLAAVEELGLADDTVVVLWGDHGWNLGEHGFWCKHTTFETSLRVPLIFAGPGIARGASPELCELVDLYPTLLELAGLPVPPHVEGLSLAAQLDDPARTSRPAALGYWQRAETVRTRDFRLTGWPRPGAGMLYDHRTDPEETENLFGRPGADGEIERIRRLAAAVRERTE